jgi:glycosyltransferase involved in cell wall biosynthesis
LSNGSPELSVVLVTDVWATIDKTVEHLRRQTARDRLELVIVAPEGSDLVVNEAAVSELGGGYQVVRVPEIRSLSWARAPGVRAARASVVVFAESHCYPDERWAEALLEAHRGPWAAVGPQVRNANPHSRLSWVNLFLDYGPWLGPTSGGEIADLPGHNSAYKKEVLADLDDDLTELLEAETLMHVALRRRGHRLYQEPGAIVYHLNVTRVSAWIQERFQTGRRFGGARGHEWPLWRRLAFALGSPLIPLVRLRRLLRDRARIGAREELSGWTYPLLGTALVVSAFGEFVGYLLGSGESMYELSKIELHKDRFVSSRDREFITAD